MCLNEEIVQPVSHTQTAFERLCLVKSCCDTSLRIRNRWVQDGNMEPLAGSQRLPIISSREDRHVTHMALLDHAATSRTLSQELGSLARQIVSARTVRRRLL
ncbi:HTH_Tnp_Tc3_2 domain-containing protein [Trichonephila clavipes]|nr:HTH_Tnp_Tc3_2 domain-containing protein [Trichonephila clavipes]